MRVGRDKSDGIPTAVCDLPLPDGFPAVAVIGGGNLGVTSAAYVKARGGNASLFIRGSERGKEKLRTLALRKNRILFSPPDGPQRTVRFDLVSDDIGEVIAGRKIILVTTPANGHVAVARQMAPYMERGMAVFLHPGQTHGALSFVKELREGGTVPEVLRTITISEFGTSLFTTRSSVENAEYSALKQYMMMACFPADKTDEALPLIQDLHPTTRFRVYEDCLAMAFHPVAAGPHTVITLSNLGDLANKRNYEFYIEGVNELNAKLIERFDEERCEIARAFGYDPTTVKTCLQEMYNLPYDNLQDLFNKNPAYKGYGSPKAMDTRYFTEEMPCGVKPLLELAEMVSVKTPMIRSVETQLDILYEDTDQDFDAEARTLSKLGLSHLTVSQLRHYVKTGELP